MVTGRASRACDACRHRKVKCNGTQPCQQCNHLNLPCSFAPPKSPRRPGVRGRRLAHLRSNAAGEPLRPALAPASALPLPPIPAPGYSGVQNEWPSTHSITSPLSHASPSVLLSPAESRTTVPRPQSAAAHSVPATSPSSSTAVFAFASPGAEDDCPYDDDFFHSLVPKYATDVYPVNPIVPPDEICRSISLRGADATHAALAYAFAAVTVNLTHTTVWALPGGVARRVRDLMARSLAARRRAAAEADAAMLLQSSGRGSGHRGCGSEEPTVGKVMTCIFLEICFMAFKKFDRAFQLLREAIAMIEMLMVADALKRDGSAGTATADDNYEALTSPCGDSAGHGAGPGDGGCRRLASAARLQRLYWEAFVHERFLTITSFLPSTLPPLPAGLPAADPTIPRHVDVGFTQIVRLFLVMDDNFLAYWIETGTGTGTGAGTGSGGADGGTAGGGDRDGARYRHCVGRRPPPMTAAWVEHKQHQLDEHERDCDDDDDSRAALTELQQADLFVTRAWLRTIVWQLAMSRCLLSSAPSPASHAGLSLSFPAAALGAQLRRLVAALSSAEMSIGMHGSGILQKLFEITNTMADVMALVPVAAAAGTTLAGAEETAFEDQQREGGSKGLRQRIADFLFLVRLLFSFERIDKVQKDIVRMKVSTLRDMFPDAGAEFVGVDAVL